MHNPKVIETKQISNEQVSYRIVCCGEKCGDECKPAAHICEDSWHTLSIHIDDHEERLKPILEAVAVRHAKVHAWREKHK